MFECLPCFQRHASESTANGTNVWGRELHDGSWAFVFLNTGTTDADITCDANCFKPTGFDSSTNLTVRDLWTHKVRHEYCNWNNIRKVAVKKKGTGYGRIFLPIRTSTDIFMYS